MPCHNSNRKTYILQRTSLFKSEPDNTNSTYTQQKDKIYGYTHTNSLPVIETSFLCVFSFMCTRKRVPEGVFGEAADCCRLQAKIALTHTNTNTTQIYKYTSIQIYKYKNMNTTELVWWVGQTEHHMVIRSQYRHCNCQSQPQPQPQSHLARLRYGLDVVHAHCCRG